MASRTKAIRAKCLDCCGGSAHEVRLCVATNCPLHPFRFGKAMKPENSHLIAVETATGKIAQIRVPIHA